MAYLKSTVVGLVALVVATIAYFIWFAAMLSQKYPVPPGVAEVSLDLRAIFGRPWFFLLAVLAFVAGFYWEFRTTIH